MSTQTLRGPGGKVIGYVITQSGSDKLILDANQKVVSKEVRGETYSASGKFVGKGQLGLTLLGK